MILDASARAVSLWPEPEEEVYEPPDAVPGAGPAAVTAYTSSVKLSVDPEGEPAPPTGPADPRQRG